MTGGEPIDMKFVFSAIGREHGTNHSHRDALLFLAHDAALPETLRAYHRACRKRGAKTRQLKHLDELLARVEAWQKAHPDALKVADWDPEAARKREKQAALTRGEPLHTEAEP